MSLPWCAELILNPVVRWRVKRRSATHPNLDALTRGLKPHGYLQETAPRSSKTSKLQVLSPSEVERAGPRPRRRGEGSRYVYPTVERFSFEVRGVLTEPHRMSTIEAFG